MRTEQKENSAYKCPGIEFDKLKLRDPYVCPMAVAISIEVEDILAKSNTEQIIDDDEEYDWDD